MAVADRSDRPAREALRHAADRLDRAEQAGRPLAVCAALARLGRCYRGVGAHDAAASAFAQALRWSRQAGSTQTATALLCSLAEMAAERAVEAARLGRPEARRIAFERARDHAFAAAQVASAADGADWARPAVLRASRLLERCGDSIDARALQQRAQQLAVAEPVRPFAAAG